MKTIRLLPLLCGLLCGTYLVTTLPAVAEARRRKKRRKHRKDSKSRAAKKQARRLFRQAQKQYRLGRFVRARKLYEKAYEVLPLPGFLYNIAQCHRMEKNFERAIFFYKSYLSAQSAARNRDMVMILITKCEQELGRIQRDRQDTEARRRADAERARAERLARLKAQLAAANRTKPQPYLPSREKKKPLVQRWWFWTSIAGGVVAAVVVGVAVGLTTSAGPGKWQPTSLGLLDRRP